MIGTMQTLARVMMAVWFAITVALAQGCVAASSQNSYSNTSAGGAVQPGASGDPVGGSGASQTASAPATTHLNTSGYTANQAESQALSGYLKQRRLPLVGAQVLHGPGGQRAVVLYGYVGSDFGKSDAAAKTSKYLGDPSVVVDNRIKVQPELLANGGSSGATKPAGDEAEANSSNNAAYPGAESYVQQQNEAQQYVQQQQTGAAVSSMAPLAILGLMALSAASGGAFSVGPGSFGSFGSYGSPGIPFGGSPGMFGGPPGLTPYSGYPSFGP
jgi:hypothetical protein